METDASSRGGRDTQRTRLWKIALQISPPISAVWSCKLWTAQCNSTDLFFLVCGCFFVFVEAPVPLRLAVVTVVSLLVSSG